MITGLRRFALLLILLAGQFAASAAAGATGEALSVIEANGRKYVALNDFARIYHFGLKYDGKIRIDGQYHHFVFTPDKKFATFNQIIINLAHAPFQSGRNFFVSLTDYFTTLLPLVSRQAVAKHQLGTIMLDPGHGGKDCGAVGKYFNEKTLSLRLARKVYARLRAFGYQVLLTRNDDRFIELEERPKMATRAGADILVSLHLNGSKDAAVAGLESFCPTPAGAASSNGSRVDFKQYSSNRFDANNMVLAYLCQRSMQQYTKAADRGVKHARFMVIKNATCPAVLLECGFITNAAEERNLGNDAYLDLLAKGISEAIRNYHIAISR